MHFGACCLELALVMIAAVAPADRHIEKGVARENLARLDKGVKWTASDGISPSHNAAQVLDGQVCDSSGRNGYWAGQRYSLPVTLDLTFPRPTTIDANVVIWYTTGIRGVDYELKGLALGGEWVELYHVRGNRYRDVVHRFAERTVTKVRFTLHAADGQNRVVMREFLLYNGLTPAEEKTLMANAANCLGPNERSKIVNLGMPVRAVEYGNSEGTVGPSPEGGHPIFYVSYYNTGGAELLAFDHRSKKVFRYDLPGSGGYGLTTGADGKIYVGMVEGGKMVQFDPETQAVRDLGKADQSITYIWACAASSDGRIFGAGYPNCIPLVYDPKTDELASPGSIRPRPGAEYLRGVAADGRGRAWFGVGMRAALVVYDPADGSWRNVLPERYADQSSVSRLVRAGDRIYASIFFSGKVLVFDADSADFVPGGAVACLAADDEFVFGSGGGKLFILDPKTEDRVQERDLGCTAMLVASDGILVVATSQNVQGLDARTLQARWILPFSAIENLKGFYSLATGPHGELYGISDLGMFRIDPAAGRLVQVTRSGSRALAADKEGRLYFGAGASLMMYDPTAE